MVDFIVEDIGDIPVFAGSIFFSDELAGLLAAGAIGFTPVDSWSPMVGFTFVCDTCVVGVRVDLD